MSKVKYGAVARQLSEYLVSPLIVQLYSIQYTVYSYSTVGLPSFSLSFLSDSEEYTVYIYLPGRRGGTVSTEQSCVKTPGCTVCV